ncbi:MAG: cation diffusion facilitator family transporter [Rhodocyclaceae bacterium]
MALPAARALSMSPTHDHVHNHMHHHMHDHDDDAHRHRTNDARERHSGHDHHDHHQDHAHGHHHHGTSARRALPWALGLTLSFALVEAVAGWWSGSLALLGDAGHMLTDSFALGLATLAAWLTARPVSDRHSFGLRRVEALSGMINSLLMILVVGFIGWHAVARLTNPVAVHGGVVMVVALLGLLLNIGVAWMLSRGEGDLNTRGALLHVLGDLLGSVAALLSGIIIHFTGWYPVDPLLSMLICGLILASTLRLLRATTHTLLEGVPPGLSLTDVGRAMARIDGVRSVHDLHIWSIDSREPALSAHVVLRDARRWPEVLEATRRLLADRYGIAHVTLQPEQVDTRVVEFHPRPSPTPADRG